jgi:hypothetical protein
MSSPNLESHLNELFKFETHLESSFGETWTPHGPHKHLGGPINGKLSKRALQI